MKEPQSNLSINLIGAGKLGKTIGKLFVLNNLGSIVGICNSTKKSAKQAADFIGKGVVFENVTHLPNALITFITVPDDKIKMICEQFSRSRNFYPGSILVHCSGLLTSDILNSAKSKGCSIVSIHPMCSFADPNLSIPQFPGTYCAIEGSIEAVPLIKNLFEKIGAQVIPVDKDKKSIYHTAGVIASNYLVTLAHHAVENLKVAGIQHEEAVDIITNLMSSTLTNISKTKSLQESLTGPIKRGDVETIKQHMSTLYDANGRELYSVLAKLTLEITDHTDDKKQLIKNAL